MFAAREILTPTNGTKVHGLDELVDGASYVVVARGNFKPIGSVRSKSRERDREREREKKKTAPQTSPLPI